MGIYRRMLLLISIFVFLLFFIVESCTRDEFKVSCLESGQILINAKKELKISHVKNISDQGKIESTVVQFDNKKAKEYLKAKSNELNTHYEIIKRYLHTANGKKNDALFVLAFINEMTFWLSGQAIEDRCRYIRLVKEKDTGELSEWIMDDVFAPFINNEHTIKAWLGMDPHAKYKDIYDFLTVSRRKDEKCP